ncbi:type I-E CRISPR-associated protein Cse1/CasA [soil metagenome]
MPTYDLIQEPWLPCMTLDGRRVEVGIRDALVRAHELKELCNPSPLVTVSLHRLLLAIIHRAYMGPRNQAAWREIWTGGRFDAKTVDGYLEQWRNRFDLFDRERPFYQVSYIEALADQRKQQPIAKLAIEASAGNNALLFDHRIDESLEVISAAEACRRLVASQGYSIGFGKSFPFYLKDSSLIRGYSLLALGESLFETLLLNLLPYNANEPIEWLGEDAPCWEPEAQPEPVEAGTPVRGYTDYLTWQSRQVHLITEDDGISVVRCQLRQNLRLAADPIDPFKSYLRDEQRGLRPRNFRPERALWRDSHLLVEQSQDESAANLRPEVMNHLAQIARAQKRQQIETAPIYRLGVFGVTTDTGKAGSVILWRSEQLPLPIEILQDDRAIEQITWAVEYAEDVNQALTTSIRAMAKFLLSMKSDVDEGRKPDEDAAIKPMLKHLGIGQRYWPPLETPFWRFLTELTGISSADDIESVPNVLPILKWKDEVLYAARAAISNSVRSHGTTPRILKAASMAEQAFEMRLKWVNKELMDKVQPEVADGT